MVERVLIGNLPGGGKGIRISEPGYDVRTNPVDNKRLMFSSDWAAALPIYAKGTFTLSKGTYQEAITQRATFTSLGYIPFGRFYIEIPGTSNVVLGPSGTTPTTIPGGWCELSASSFMSSQAQSRAVSTATVGTVHTYTYVRLAIRDGSIWATYAGSGADPASLSIAWFIYKLKAK